jgi:hypothetical protein
LLFLFLDDPAAGPQSIAGGIGLDEENQIVWRLVKQEICSEASR